MSLFRLFLSRCCGVVLIASGIAMLFVREQWGQEDFLCLAWSGLWAVGLGVIGFRSLRKTLTCEPHRMAGELLKGVVQRALVLFASVGLVHAIVGAPWSQRALLMTTVLYLLVLGVEVLTLSQALNRGELKPSAQGVQLQETSKTESNKKTESMDRESPEGAKEEASR